MIPQHAGPQVSRASMCAELAETIASERALPVVGFISWPHSPDTTREHHARTGGYRALAYLNIASIEKGRKLRFKYSASLLPLRGRTCRSDGNCEFARAKR